MNFQGHWAMPHLQGEKFTPRSKIPAGNRGKLLGESHGTRTTFPGLGKALLDPVYPCTAFPFFPINPPKKGGGFGLGFPPSERIPNIWQCPKPGKNGNFFPPKLFFFPFFRIPAFPRNFCQIFCGGDFSPLASCPEPPKFTEFQRIPEGSNSPVTDQLPTAPIPDNPVYPMDIWFPLGNVNIWCHALISTAGNKNRAGIKSWN